MKIHLWGTDFRRSSAEFRRTLFIAPEDRANRLRGLLAYGFDDLVYLNTCNRIEFYTTSKDYFSDTRPLWIEMLKEFGLAEDSFYLGYQLEGKSALRHLLRVASSLESLVVGEPQILGQLRDGVRWTLERGLPMSPTLKKAFHLAFETAKTVRHQTTIGEESVSVASLGMEQLERMEVDYPLTDVVIVGRSPMSIIVVAWLKKNRPNVRLRWVTRSPEVLKKESMAAGVHVEELSRFIIRPGAFSHLFTSSGNSESIFDEAFFHRVDSPRPLAFDFAEPPDIVQLPEGSRARVIRLDDLKVLAERNRALRRSAAAKAEILIDSAIRDFFQEQKEAPVLKNFSGLEPKLLEEVSTALHEISWERLNPEGLKVWAERLVKRNLHTARVELKAVLKSVAESDAVQTNEKWEL